jgi:hypothetical protein
VCTALGAWDDVVDVERLLGVHRPLTQLAGCAGHESGEHGASAGLVVVSEAGRVAGHAHLTVGEKSACV